MPRTPLHSVFKMYFNLKITRTGAQMSKYTLLQTTQYIYLLRDAIILTQITIGSIMEKS